MTASMSAYSYRLLEADEIPAYVLERGFVPDPLPTADALRADEVSDGNLNRVFIIRADPEQPGLVLKQALPWVRVHGEGWPLSPERAAAEARGYEAYRAFAAEFIPRYHGYHADRYVLAMEDLGDLRVWRGALNDGEIHPAVAEVVGTFVARIGFHTSDLGMHAEERKVLAAESVNPDLCRITEDVVLREPYIEHEHNHCVDGVAALASELRRDGTLHAEVAALKHTFMTHAEALVHGDLHSGSIMVGGGRVAIIDPEFCFYGPLGFDLGVFWGNCAIAAVRARLLDASEEFAADVGAGVADSWAAFCGELEGLWPQRVDDSFDAPFLAGYRRKVWRDGLGFAGTESMRRVIGYAHASDIHTLPFPEQKIGARAVARISRRLILERALLDGPQDVMGMVGEEVDRAIAEQQA